MYCCINSVTDSIPSRTGMSGSGEAHGVSLAESARVILADEEDDWSVSGQSQTRKLRSKQLRNGFNCLGFIPVDVLNQRRSSGNGLRRGARQGLQIVRELTCRFCFKKSSVFVAHKRVGLQIHIREKHKDDELLPKSSNQHDHQRKLSSNNYASDSRQFSSYKEVERYDACIWDESYKELSLKLSQKGGDSGAGQ